MKIAYFSPFNPLKSGVSDYSEELIPELSKYMDIDLYTTDFKISSDYIARNYAVYPISSFNEKSYKKYDEVVYHIGNNTKFHNDIYLTALKFPGISVIHDYSIHHLIANLTVARGDWEGYIREMHYNYGKEGERLARLSSEGKTKVLWETDQTLKYPANKRLIEASKGVIVHSKMAEGGIIDVKENAFVQYAPLFTSDIEIIDEERIKLLRNKYNISEDCLVFSSFGFISRAKRIHSILVSLKKVIENQPDINITYLIVGQEEDGVDEIQKLIKSLNLEKHCKVTGYVTLEEFKDYIMLSDVCFNLRYPTQGESSASLLRILGYGKPAIVSKVGSFSEFPDDFTIKIRFSNQDEEQEDIIEVIKWFVTHKDSAKEMGKKAVKYIKENHSIEKTAQAYLMAIESLKNQTAFCGNSRFYLDYIERFTLNSKDIIEYSEVFQRKFALLTSEFFR
ncbi:glycosyltransferase [Paenibacillus vini]|uniref:glycosyltransferase family 4 protein n=1 Tax=Paenibacillus vini TaxID=1476024 RepID=UPI0025B6C227|nr:glycosyltransferase [Paenibacillus vini]MDN4066515.1 glycosyltransferase [Paenibacillus vini]